MHARNAYSLFDQFSTGACCSKEYFNASSSLETWERKTSIDLGKFYEKVFSSLQMGYWKIWFEF